MKLNAVFLAAGIVLACGMLPAAGAWAQSQGPKRAIERLEGCSAEERRSGCVKILKKKSAGGDLEEIKAQIRGGRIIWYQYNRRSGAVRRLN